MTDLEFAYILLKSIAITVFCLGGTAAVGIWVREKRIRRRPLIGGRLLIK
jgi:hypothetical protein